MYWNDSGTIATLGTLQKFRDPSAWGHFVLAMDTTDATAADRMKFYWNGERITEFEDGLDTITQNKTMDWLGDTNGRITVGAAKTSTNWHYWDGCMAHVQYVDGLALAPTEFGETDSTSGIWKLKTTTYATPGTNGFHLKFENSANMDLDSSSNAHTFTTSGTLTPTLDNPSNNFNTLNPLERKLGVTYTWKNGNTNVTTAGGSGWHGAVGTLMMEKGKWYMETFLNYAVGGVNTVGGFTSVRSTNHKGVHGQFGYQDYPVAGTYGPCVGWYDSGSFLWSSAAAKEQSTGSQWTSPVQNDVVMHALDLDNGKVYVGVNGTWDSRATTHNPAAGTGGQSFVPGGLLWTTAVQLYYAEAPWNFGNGYFGTTAISSPSADADGYGKFKYAPPAGFKCICTKQIATYG